MSSPFDYVNSINVTKTNMMRNTENDELAEKGYEPFLTNRSLSYFEDTIGMANEMNFRSGADKILQYEFLLNTIRKRKRFSKWIKPEKNDELSMIQEFYGYSRAKAEEAAKILTNEHINEIKNKLSKGGLMK
jgi:hypothetical protein